MSNRSIALPNCLVIGAMRSGTSTLHQLLAQHPDIFMSTPKEPNYFAFAGQAGIEVEGSACITDRSAYERLFEPGAQHRVRGESSHNYLYYSGDSAPRIRELLTEVKLVAVLRNPVDRAFSHYMLHVRNELESAGSFRAALDMEDERYRTGVQFGHYVRRGFYAQQLRPYLELFPKPDLRVYLYEELADDPVALGQDAYAFVGVDPGFVPDTSVRSNPSGVPRSRTVQALLVKDNPVKRLLQPLLPRPMYRMAARIRDRNLAHPPIPGEVRDELRNVYRRDIEDLQDLLGRDLSAWLK